MSKKRIDKNEIIKCSVIILIFLVINIIFRNVIGKDYDDFLVHWIEESVKLGKIESLSTQVGNYTPPYMYFLIIGTYTTTNYIFWIKFVSNIFTIGIGIVVYFILKEFKKDIKLSSALIVLLIPSVFVNSSIIGQCDSIYTFFVLLFIVLLLKNKKRSALFFYGVSIAFKMQALFIAPVFLYLLLKKKIKILDLVYIVLGFIIPMTPAMFYGRSIWDIIKVFVSQTGTYLKFVKSAPNMYSLLHLNYRPMFYLQKIVLSILTIILSVFVVLRNIKGKEYSNKAFLEKVMLLSLVVPYFLPSMHDRYFYMTNIFIYIYFIFIDDTRNIKNQVINVILVSIACALPVILFNFVSQISEMASFLAEWLGVTMISSTIMTYIILVCFDRYLTNNNVTKKLQ